MTDPHPTEPPDDDACRRLWILYQLLQPREHVVTRWMADEWLDDHASQKPIEPWHRAFDQCSEWLRARRLPIRRGEP